MCPIATVIMHSLLEQEFHSTKEKIQYPILVLRLLFLSDAQISLQTLASLGGSRTVQVLSVATLSIKMLSSHTH